ncbi:MerR family transcriptional regulator [Paenibacillus sp. sptzw28]|uniref:MerR family transcriptional regulator n=1 Tax=Paenibacillus sp. sptzw28 TaxID=715179 RepID=UPI001C6E0917|nr:MerR family transcriptional regulator [Paenibacillus sp. sptzw28]QYR20222.1 MerR family transcriptional regulator [Paenibacillus sp. sptzw28]
MNYTISDVARIFNLSVHTLRFYDKEGLFPFISRNKSGNRVFTAWDLDWIALICCLKNTGMQIKDIKQYCDWAKEGSITGEIRKELFNKHRTTVLKQIEDLNKNLELIDTKIAFYENPENDQLMDQLARKVAGDNMYPLTPQPRYPDHIS